nr:hypothetical protein [Tanacetum cinerariifolium]
MDNQFNDLTNQKKRRTIMKILLQMLTKTQRIEDPTKADVVPKQDNIKWFKHDVIKRPKTPDPESFKEPNTNYAPKQPLLNELVNGEKDPKEFDDLMGSTIDFIKFAKHCLKKDKPTKANLEGPTYALLKGNYKNNIELEYNMEQCYLALTNHIDWANTEGDRFSYDLSKPIPLQGPPGHTSIPIDFFFNKDLEYSKNGNKEKKYASSLTKPKATRCVGSKVKEPCTILYKPRGVVYLNKSNCKFLMRDEELYKFSDGMLKPVHDTLNLMLHNFVLGFNNESMPNGAWSKKY